MVAEADVKTRKVFFFLFVLFEIAFIILFRTVADFANVTSTSFNNDNYNQVNSLDYAKDRLEYIFFVNIITMTLIGYGLLYSYNRAHGFTAFLYTLLISGVTFQWALLMNEFWERVNSGEWSQDFFITIPSLIKACYTTTAVLITFGTVYGRANIVQLVFIAGFEALAYALNRYIIQYQLNTNEIELAIFVHVFGAFFGIGVSLFTSSGSEAAVAGHDGSTQDSNIVSVLGTLILFAFFPSYNAFVASPAHRTRVIVNTFLATTSSALVTFAFSAMTNGGKWRLSEIRNATIVGGVAMALFILVLCGPAAAA
jgi:ammonium transporter Rh